MKPALAAIRSPATAATSAAVREANAAKRRSIVLTVTGISRGKLIHVEPAEFGKIDVDPRYQRGETNMVNTIIAAIQAGGLVLDPPTLCRRTCWGNDGRDKDKMWIVDGHQRVSAFQHLSMGFDAIVHESESLDAERQYFIALNSRRAVSTNLIVKSWAGPSGKLLVEANANPAHPLYERVRLEMGANESRIGAMVLIRGSLNACTGVEMSGEAPKVLGRLDVALITDINRKVIMEKYLRMMGQVLPKGTVHNEVALAFANVYRARMGYGQFAMPDAKQTDRLRKINWDAEVPHLTRKFRPVVTNIIDRIWKD